MAREQATAEKALVASERQRVIYERKVAQLEVCVCRRNMPFPSPNPFWIEGCPREESSTAPSVLPTGKESFIPLGIERKFQALTRELRRIS